MYFIHFFISIVSLLGIYNLEMQDFFLITQLSWASELAYMDLNILERLPITSLFSAKLLCKSSYHLVSHPMLTPHYHDLYKNPYWLIIRLGPSSSTEPFNNNQLYLIDSSIVLRKIIQPMIKRHSRLELSCNGLLCL